MACFILPDERDVAAYRGLDSIFEYTNCDGTCVRTNCGQAAAATLLTFHGKLQPQEDRAQRVMIDLERTHPADNLGGWFGTSQRRVRRMCHAFGLRTANIEGAEALRLQLDRRNPVIVMLGVSAGRFLGFSVPGGHWMVAYAYDHNHIYLTNWGRMTWAEFQRGWQSLVPRLIGMRNRGLVHLSS